MLLRRRGEHFLQKDSDVIRAGDAFTQDLGADSERIITSDVEDARSAVYTLRAQVTSANVEDVK